MKMKEYFGTNFEVSDEALKGFNNGFDNPYEALKFANKKWDFEPDSDICRLLVVIEKNLEQETVRYAFFQFTDSKSCKQFIKNNEEIKWSYSYADRVWNGNAKLMN